jgi:hypothetical protein
VSELDPVEAPCQTIFHREGYVVGEVSGVVLALDLAGVDVELVAEGQKEALEHADRWGRLPSLDPADDRLGGARTAGELTLTHALTGASFAQQLSYLDHFHILSDM